MNISSLKHISLFTRSNSCYFKMAMVSSFLADCTNTIVSHDVSPSKKPKMDLSTSGPIQQPRGGACNGMETEGGPINRVSDMALRVKKLSEFATVPTRGSPQAAGYDLYSAYDVTLPAEGKAIVKTDIAIAIPEGSYGRVAPRSGLSWKHHIDVGAGVIDYDYRGNVGVVLFNLAKQDYQVKRGDRVAQLVLERIFTPPVQEMDLLPDTERGAGGYGSTGK